jgi:hypothetical protein
VPKLPLDLLQKATIIEVKQHKIANLSKRRTIVKDIFEYKSFYGYDLAKEMVDSASKIAEVIKTEDIHTEMYNTIIAKTPILGDELDGYISNYPELEALLPDGISGAAMYDMVRLIYNIVSGYEIVITNDK